MGRPSCPHRVWLELPGGRSDPEGCPPNRLFVPQPAKSPVLQQGHASKIASHPCFHHTLALVQQQFWWPTMSADTREYGSACTRSKASHRPPAGLLRPLPVPHQPWSHIAVDFVTGLPLSEGNTTILTIVDRFSKAVHFNPLSKLPSALDTTTLLIKHVFWLHASLRTLFQTEAPSFLHRFGKSFAGLSSGYHPHTNGQTERANQDLETALHCVTSHHPASWSTHLPWVEYAHNSLVCSATGMSPFVASNGFQPPLFPSQEADSAVSSMQGHLQRARRVW